jgi:hypothetical protein
MFIRIWAFNFTFYEIWIIRFLKIRCTGDYVPKTLLEKTQSSPHSIIGPHGFHGISACCRLPLSPATNANVSTHIPECSVRRIVSRILIKVHVCGTPWREVKDKRKNGSSVYVQARLRGGSLESALIIYTHISKHRVIDCRRRTTRGSCMQVESFECWPATPWTRPIPASSSVLNFWCKIFKLGLMMC